MLIPPNPECICGDMSAQSPLPFLTLYLLYISTLHCDYTVHLRIDRSRIAFQAYHIISYYDMTARDSSLHKYNWGLRIWEWVGTTSDSMIPIPKWKVTITAVDGVGVDKNHGPAARARIL